MAADHGCGESAPGEAGPAAPGGRPLRPGRGCDRRRGGGRLDRRLRDLRRGRGNPARARLGCRAKGRGAERDRSLRAGGTGGQASREAGRLQDGHCGECGIEHREDGGDVRPGPRAAGQEAGEGDQAKARRHADQGDDGGRLGSREWRIAGAWRGTRRLAVRERLAVAVPVADVYEVASHLPAYVSLAAAAAFVLLLPLYFSQRRDLARLHAWMEREPGHPAADLEASEGLLDRAETELEAVLGPPREALGDDEATAQAATAQAAAEPTHVAPPAPAAQGGSLSPAQRVTHERPALERITMERAALLPHPRWRRMIGRIGQTWVLSAIAAAAVLLGLA